MKHFTKFVHCTILSMALLGTLQTNNAHANTHELQTYAEPTTSKKVTVLTTTGKSKAMQSIASKKHNIRILTKNGYLTYTYQNGKYVPLASTAKTTYANSATPQVYPDYDQANNRIIDYEVSDNRRFITSQNMLIQEIDIPVTINAHYRVQQGDTLAAIHQVTAIPTKQLVADNEIYDIHNIQINQELQLRIKQ